MLKKWVDLPGFLCVRCFDNRRDADKCATCNQPLGFGTYTTLLDKKFHPKCLTCVRCKQLIDRNAITQIDNWPACVPCATKAMNG